jgi:hypothetical protein
MLQPKGSICGTSSDNMQMFPCWYAEVNQEQRVAQAPTYAGRLTVAAKAHLFGYRRRMECLASYGHGESPQ